MIDKKGTIHAKHLCNRATGATGAMLLAFVAADQLTGVVARSMAESQLALVSCASDGLLLVLTHMLETMSGIDR